MAKNRQKSGTVIGNTITYMFSSVGLIILVLVYAFIFKNGFSLINTQLITGDYYSDAYYIVPSDNNPSSFTKPDDLSSEAYFSTNWGIALVDYTDSAGKSHVLVEYIDSNSPLANVVDATGSSNDLSLSVGMDLNKMTLVIDDEYVTAGSSKGQTASDIVSQLDASSQISELFVKSLGGGIRGSIVATIITIVISLILSIPISVAAAVYINEYSSKNRFINLMRSGIELLAGVPSIIYGLVGVVVFYPVASAFNATGNTILLGSLTMVIVLFPVIIRTTEEALKVVPNNLREASLSLGATKTQTIFKVVLPSAISGILTAVLLSIGRVIGESAALIYTMGTIVTDHPTPTSTGTTLAVQIWKEMSGEQPNIALASAISLVILVIVLILNTVVKLISLRINKKYS